MFDTHADLVIAIALVASIAATACSLRFALDVRPARRSLGDPGLAAASATAFVLGVTVATMGVLAVLWFAAIATDGLLPTVSPLLFCTWLVLLFTCTREALRGVLLLTSGCAPTGAAAP